MFVPPVQAHSDAVIFSNEFDKHTEVLDDEHQEEHHQNDTEEDKNTEHHHHCTSLGFSNAFIVPFVANTSLIRFDQVIKPIHYYQKSLLANYLETLTEPPEIKVIF